MRLKSLISLCAVLFAVVVIGIVLPWKEIAVWAASMQREFQNSMAASLQAIKAGEPAATWSLCLATAAYGFMHALGPGHGKILLGGAGLASGATLRQMIILSLAASLAQAVCAILLITIVLQGVQVASRDAVDLAEIWLAPISYIAISAIGAVLVARGIRELCRLLSVNMSESQHSSCGHRHGVSLSEVKSLQSRRDIAALIGSIAIRPCTGALFLLVIAARFDIFFIGVLATLTMGLGTALFNILVAGSGVAARRLAYVGSVVSGPGLQSISAGLHIVGGLLVVGLSLVLLLPVMA